MKSKLVLVKAQQGITHKIQAGIALLIAVLMIFNTTRPVTAANNDSTVLNLVVTAGVLEIMNADASATFNSVSAGTSGTINTITGNTVVKDYRSGPGQWIIYSNAAAMVGGTDSNYTIPATNITVFPSTATIFNIETFNNQSNAINYYASHNLGANIGMFNSSHNAVGAVGINGLQLNATVNAQLTAQTYSGTMLITVIAV